MPIPKFNKLATQFATLFAAYDSLSSYHLEIPEYLRDKMAANRQWITWLREPEFPIAFLGSFSAGKSTIINAILNRYILPENMASMTAVPTFIRKGEQDSATIYYLGDKEKANLISLYIEEVNMETDLDVPTDVEPLLNKENRTIFLKNLTEKIDEIKKNRTLSQSISALAEIKQVVEEWDKHNGDVKVIHDLSKLKDYVTEQAEGILFIDRTEVRVKDIDLPKDIVLVDLPGLGVANKRHQQITKTFIEKEAKAFVVCMMPRKILQGGEVIFLDKVNKQNSTILERAFWIINQWDALLDTHKKETDIDFQTRVRKCQFNINRDRIFKVSALAYLVDTLQKRKNDLDSESLKYLEAKKDILKKAKGYETLFPKFSDKLFDYLNNTAKNEFLDYAKIAFRDIQQQLLNILEPLVAEYGLEDEEERRLSGNAEYLMDKIDNLQIVLTDIVEEVAMIRLDYLPEGGRTIWSNTNRNKVIADAKQMIKKIDTFEKYSLLNELAKGEAIDVNYSRLPQKLEEYLKLVKVIKETLNNQMLNTVHKDFSQKLLVEIRKATNEMLPLEIDKLLADKLGSRDLENRTKGLLDYLTYRYGAFLEEAGIKLSQKIKELLNPKELTENEETNNINQNGEKSNMDALIEGAKKGFEWYRKK